MYTKSIELKQLEQSIQDWSKEVSIEALVPYNGYRGKDILVLLYNHETRLYSIRGYSVTDSYWFYSKEGTSEPLESYEKALNIFYRLLSSYI